MAVTASTVNLQEIAQAIANTISTQLNSVATSVVGVDIMYFPAVPVGEQTDFLFHDYTLYNVRPCPLEFKAVYTNSGYDESNYVFSQMGVDYQSPLELEIDINTWNTAVNNEDVEPRAGDIIYIPITNKLLEVSSMNPGKTVGQLTSYKVSCKKYQPSAHRYVGGALADAIDNNTVSVDKKYNDKVKGMIQDLIDDTQTSPYTISSETDPYRDIAKTKSRDSDKIINIPAVNCVKDFGENNFTVDGHLVAKYYYENNIAGDYVVKYKTSDSYAKTDVRCLSIWFNIQNTSESVPGKINSIEILGKEKKNTKLKLAFTSKKSLENKPVLIQRGSIRIYGTVVDNIILVPSSIISKLPKGWNELTGFTIQESDPNNLLTANADTKFEININANRYLSVVTDNVYTYDLGKTLEYNHWYGLIINLKDGQIEYSLFDGSPNLKHLNSSSGIFKWFNNTVYNYYIKPSSMLMTNIRLYNKENAELSSQMQDLVTYNIPNAGNAVINDSADKYLNFKFYAKNI